MPLTAKLSRKFYERFGDDIADELVDWYNKVDESYRANLRELNDLNFARFDAKLEQRIAEQSAMLRTEAAAQGSAFRAEMASLRTELMDAMQALRTDLRTEMAANKVEMMRWMFALWVTQMLALVGFLVADLLRG
jgi:hypothetical protein